MVLLVLGAPWLAFSAAELVLKGLPGREEALFAAAAVASDAVAVAAASSDASDLLLLTAAAAKFTNYCSNFKCRGVI